MRAYMCVYIYIYLHRCVCWGLAIRVELLRTLCSSHIVPQRNDDGTASSFHVTAAVAAYFCRRAIALGQPPGLGQAANKIGTVEDRLAVAEAVRSGPS